MRSTHSTQARKQVPPGVSVRTEYNRQERWNADGLVPGYVGGYPSKFTTELKPELFEKVREKDPRTIVEARHQSHFGVVYSPGIPTSFDMRFGNPYPWDHRRPAVHNARELPCG